MELSFQDVYTFASWSSFAGAYRDAQLRWDWEKQEHVMSETISERSAFWGLVQLLSSYFKIPTINSVQVNKSVSCIQKKKSIYKDGEKKHVFPLTYLQLTGCLSSNYFIGCQPMREELISALLLQLSFVSNSVSTLMPPRQFPLKHYLLIFPEDMEIIHTYFRQGKKEYHCLPRATPAQGV